MRRRSIPLSPIITYRNNKLALPQECSRWYGRNTLCRVLEDAFVMGLLVTKDQEYLIEQTPDLDVLQRYEVVCNPYLRFPDPETWPWTNRCQIIPFSTHLEIWDPHQLEQHLRLFSHPFED
ncbi:hypothetical protein GF342_00175 [Candidatus Woesearchaeota archaeon]|nr:hypothetical protein [Candidatus Woesearchaeota archaeon]